MATSLFLVILSQFSVERCLGNSLSSFITSYSIALASSQPVLCGALESPYLLPSHPTISLSSHITLHNTILTSTYSSTSLPPSLPLLLVLILALFLPPSSLIQAQAESRRRRKQREKEREGMLAAKVTMDAAASDYCDWRAQPIALVREYIIFDRFCMGYVFFVCSELCLCCHISCILITALQSLLIFFYPTRIILALHNTIILIITPKTFNHTLTKSTDQHSNT